MARTRQKLKEAFLALLIDRRLHEIHIKEITGRAGVNRVTFYDHYSTKEELLWELVNDKLREYAKIIDFDSRTAREVPRDLEQIHWQKVALTIEHIRENATFYRVMLLGNGRTEASDRIQEQLSQSLLSVLKLVRNRSPEIDLTFYAQWIMGGAIGIFKQWLRDGLKQPDAYVVDQLYRLTMSAGRLIAPVPDAVRNEK